MNKYPNYPRKTLTGLFLLTCSLSLASTVSYAQEEDKEEEIFELSPFEVDASKDVGYRATNSISGTRLNTEIKDVPLNLEVITSEFIKDTGATNLREALRYSAGVILESQSDAFVEPDGDWSSAGANDPQGATRRAGDSTTKLRGFVIDQVLRDGFRRQYAADSINIGRVEVVRGPSALLYGVGSFGGVINFVPKAPSRESSLYMGASLGSHGLVRAEFDSTGAIGGEEKEGAFRVTGAYENRGDHTQFYQSEHFMISPVFSFKPLPNTTIVFDNEIGYSEQNGVGFQNLRSNVNAASSRTAGWLTDPYPEQVTPRTFRWSGDDTYLKGSFNNHVIDVTQKFSDNLYAKLGFSYSRAEFNSRQIRNTGTVASPFNFNTPDSYDSDATVSIDGTSYNLRGAIVEADTNGDFLGRSIQDLYNLRPAGSYRGDKLYGYVANNTVEWRLNPTLPPQVQDSAAIRYEWNDSEKVETRDQVRFDLNYKFKTGEWGSHNVVIGAQYMGLQAEDDQFGPGYSFPGHSVLDTDRYSYHSPEDLGTFNYGVQGDGRPDNPRQHLYNLEDKTWDMGYYAVYQGQFFKERLTLIGGVREDRNDRRSVTNYIWEEGRDPQLTSRVQDKAPTATSPQAGLSYAINDNITVFGLYSTGVVPNYYARDGNGNAFDPTKATNREIGIKFDALEGKLSGTLSAYKIERKNTPKFLWWAPSPYNSIKNGYDPAKQAASVWSYPDSSSVWYAIKNTPDGLNVAKEVWPAAFHETFDAMAAVGPGSDPNYPADEFYNIPGVSRWWDWGVDESGKRGLMAEAEANFNLGRDDNDVYFPLVDMSNPSHAAFAKAGKVDFPGWGGNWFYTPGQTYYFGSGATGEGNAPDGNGADVALSDQAKGWDLSLIYTPTENLQMVFNYAHVEREVTTPTYKFVEAPYWPFGWWYVKDGYFGTLDYNRSAEEAYGDVTDTSTYNAPIPEYQQSADDTPENSASLWIRYSLANYEPVKNFTVGFGARWEDKRQWFTGFSGGGGNITTIENADGVRELVQLWTDPRLTLSGFAEYTNRINDKYDVRLALNVDNILNDQGRYGEIFAPGTSWRFSSGISF